LNTISCYRKNRKNCIQTNYWFYNVYYLLNLTPAKKAMAAIVANALTIPPHPVVPGFLQAMLF
jgi:hypothetical protein